MAISPSQAWAGDPACESKVRSKSERSNPDNHLDSDTANCSSFQGQFAKFKRMCQASVENMKNAHQAWLDAGEKSCNLNTTVANCEAGIESQVCDVNRHKIMAEQAVQATKYEEEMAQAAVNAAQGAKATIATLLDKQKKILDQLEKEKKAREQAKNSYSHLAGGTTAKDIGAADETTAIDSKSYYGKFKSERLENLSKDLKPVRGSQITGKSSPITEEDISNSGALVSQPLQIAKFGGEFEEAMKQRLAELEAKRQELERQAKLSDERAKGLGDDKGPATKPDRKGDITGGGNDKGGGGGGPDQGGGQEGKPDSSQAGGGEGGAPPGGGGGDSGGGGGAGDSGSYPTADSLNSIDSTKPITNDPTKLRTEGQSIFGEKTGSGDTTPKGKKAAANNLTPAEGLPSGVSLSSSSSTLQNSAKRKGSGGYAAGDSSTDGSGGSGGLGSSSSRDPAESPLKGAKSASPIASSSGTFDSTGSLGTPEFSLPGSELEEFSQTLANDLSGGKDLLLENEGGLDGDFSSSSEGAITETEGDFALVELQQSFRKVFVKYEKNGSLMGPPKRGAPLKN